MFLDSIRRVFMVKEIIDFRKFFNGLLDEAYSRGWNPYAGDALVCLNRTGTQIRLLVGDSVGLFVLSRRFDGKSPGRKKLLESTKTSISVAELGMLLQGNTFKIERQASEWQPNKELLDSVMAPHGPEN